MQQRESFGEVRSFTRFLTLGVTVGIGVALCVVVYPSPTLPVLLSFLAGSGLAWRLSGWLADAAFRPIPSTVERGVVVGLLVAVVSSIGFGFDVARPVPDGPSGSPLSVDTLKTYAVAFGIVSALAVVPGTVLGAVLGLAVQARARRALHQGGAGEKIKTA